MHDDRIAGSPIISRTCHCAVDDRTVRHDRWTRSCPPAGSAATRMLALQTARRPASAVRVGVWPHLHRPMRSGDVGRAATTRTRRLEIVKARTRQGGRAIRGRFVRCTRWGRTSARGEVRGASDLSNCGAMPPHPETHRRSQTRAPERMRARRRSGQAPENLPGSLMVQVSGCWRSIPKRRCMSDHTASAIAAMSPAGKSRAGRARPRHRTPRVDPRRATECMGEA